MNNDMWMTIWTATAAIAACIAVVITFIFSYRTVELIQAQTAPRIVVYVNHDPERPTLLFIVIANVGNDVAENIRFTSSRPIPANAFGLPGHAVKSSAVMTAGPLVTGIPALGPSGTREIIWGQYGGLEIALADGPIRISFTYQQGKRRFNGEVDLEIASFADTAATEPPVVKLVRHAEKIEKHLAELSRTGDRLARSLIPSSRRRSFVARMKQRSISP